MAAGATSSYLRSEQTVRTEQVVQNTECGTHRSPSKVGSCLLFALSLGAALGTGDDPAEDLTLPPADTTAASTLPVLPMTWMKWMMSGRGRDLMRDTTPAKEKREMIIHNLELNHNLKLKINKK